MEEKDIQEKFISQTKRKTMNYSMSNNMLLESSHFKKNIFDLKNNNIDELLKEFEDLNGTFFTDKIFKIKTKKRDSFCSRIPSPGKDCNINLGKKYKNFESKL